MEVEIISSDCIKPSSPTPSFLKNHYMISMLDQSMPFTYIPVILYYVNHGGHVASKRSQILKQSLSETLTQFYPLAGKVADDLSMECNDGGVLYLEAKANVTLYEYLKKPHLSSLHKLVPNKTPLYAPSPGSYVTMVQETTFACSGTTLAITVLHLAIEGCGLASFLKAWATMAVESTKKCPSFDGSSIFPKIDNFPKDANAVAIWAPFIRVGNMNMRRFVFDGPIIASLKEIAISSGVKSPTRVEVVTALLSKTLMAVFKSKSGNRYKPIAIHHAVNIRKRMLPTMPECSMGNFILFADTIYNQKEPQLSSLVGQVKQAIAKIDSDFVKSIEGDGGFAKLYEKIKEMKNASICSECPNGLDYVFFSSWCNFGLNEVDFGWGKPIWTTCAGSYGNMEAPFMNYVVLMDARCNNGIEAWVVLDEEGLVLLERNEELLEYASHHPSPLY